MSPVQPTTIAVFRSVRSHLTTEQTRELLRQNRPASLAEWDVALCAMVGTDASQWLPQLLRAGLAAWAGEQTDARDVLQALTLDDRRLGVWCTAAVAETVLHLIPAGEERPRVAVETARAWVHGLATKEDCRKAADNAYNSSADSTSTAAYAAADSTSSTATAAFAASKAYAANAAANAAAFAAAAYAYPANAQTEAFQRRLHELCAVIAAAILTFPVE